MRLIREKIKAMFGNKQFDFLVEVKKNYPEAFKNVRVLDCGSIGINRDNRLLFSKLQYYDMVGVAIRDVKLETAVHELNYKDGYFDTVISNSMLEYDKHYKLSLANMLRMLRPGGLLLFTCLNQKRKLTVNQICQALDLSQFQCCGIKSDGGEIYFYGIKRISELTRLSKVRAN